MMDKEKCNGVISCVLAALLETGPVVKDVNHQVHESFDFQWMKLRLHWRHRNRTKTSDIFGAMKN